MRINTGERRRNPRASPESLEIRRIHAPLMSCRLNREAGISITREWSIAAMV